jgi:hypothetical protein
LSYPKNASYNATIAAGQSVNVGFNAAPGHVTAGPTGYILNGAAVGTNTQSAGIKAQFIAGSAHPGEPLVRRHLAPRRPLHARRDAVKQEKDPNSLAGNESPTTR